MHPKLKLTLDPNLIESEAWNQIQRTLNISCLVKLAIMPDVHAGYDLPIGGVALIDNYIWPGAVGFDIGCGMCHVKTFQNIEELNLIKEKDQQDLYNLIVEKIPVGFNSRKKTMYTPEEFPGACAEQKIIQKVQSKMFKQLGTLGGGNHFIEIGINEKREIGITVHSGSRNPGHTIGGFYMDLAKSKGEKFGKGIGMFHIDSDYGQSYLKDMKWAENYALQNRKIILNEVLDCIGIKCNHEIINENHNHAIVYDNNNILHRKGATPAEKGQLGIIPGNQRDGTYITRGLGNSEFLNSASHGAGRCMSRKAAKNNIDLEEFKNQMGNIICRTDNDVLDEAPDAYKDINQIIELQKGLLIEVVDYFKPLIVVKG